MIECSLKISGTTKTGLIQETLNVNDLASGNYILRITGKDLLATKKLVIKYKSSTK